MKRKLLKIFFLWILIFVIGLSSSNACRTEKIDRSVMLKTLELHKEVTEYLEKENIELAFIGRKGMANKYIEYTHMGVIWKNGEEWTVTDLLQPCEGEKPHLYDEGVAEFFVYSKVSTVKLLIPSKKTQDEFKQTLINKEADKFLGQKYNLLSYVWGTEYQNCTQYILEVYSYIASGKTADSRKAALKWAKENGYEPGELKAAFITRNIARLHKHLALDDHQDKKNLKIATVDSIFEFVKNREPESVIIEFTAR